MDPDPLHDQLRRPVDNGLTDKSHPHDPSKMYIPTPSNTFFCLIHQIVPASVFRAGAPVIQRHYATIPAVTSPAQTPAVQRSSEPKKGVMDYVLTTADSVSPVKIPS